MEKQSAYTLQDVVEGGVAIYPVKLKLGIAWGRGEGNRFYPSRCNGGGRGDLPCVAEARDRAGAWRRTLTGAQHPAFAERTLQGY